MTLRILIADDHEIVRDGLCALIDKQKTMTVVGQAINGREAVQMVRHKKPDVVIMDLSMPELNGIDATKEITAETPGCKVIILSMHSEKNFIIGALQAGASGYLLKECAFQELIQALDAVSSGQTYLSPQVAHVVVSDYKKQMFQVVSRKTLTTKERAVLQLLAEGHGTREIAERLCVSIKAVEARRRRIMEKLDINTVAGLIKYAIREGLTEL